MRLIQQIAPVQQLQCNRPGAFIARRQTDPVCRLPGSSPDLQLPGGSRQKHAFPRLRNAVKSGVQQCVAADIALLFQDLADFLSDILAAMVQHVGHVFHQDRERLKGAPYRRYSR